MKKNVRKGIAHFPGINRTTIFHPMAIFLFSSLSYKNKIKSMQDSIGSYWFSLFILFKNIYCKLKKK